MKKYLKKILIIFSLILILGIALYQGFVNAKASSTPVEDSKLKYFDCTLWDINPTEFNKLAMGEDKTAENHTIFVPMEHRLADSMVQGYANRFTQVKQAARQGIVQNKLSNNNIVLTKKNNNGMELFPERSQAENKNLVGEGKPYQEILRNWKLPFIREENGYFSLDVRDGSLGGKYQVQKNNDKKKLDLYRDDNNTTLGFFPFSKLDESTREGSNNNTNNTCFTMRLDIPFYMTSSRKNN